MNKSNSTTHNPLANQRIGFVGKGGAGKSTITILMAYALREQGYEVCILDADSTNIGMHRALGIEKAPASLIDYFGGMVFSGGSVTCPVDDPTPLPDAELHIDELPSEYLARNPQGITLLTAGKIGDLGPGAGCDGPINKIARDVRLYANTKPLLTLVDFKAGFEDSARGAITGLDWVLVIVDPTHASLQMALHMKSMVEKMKTGVPPATEHLASPELVELARNLFRVSKIKDVLAILNRIRDEEVESYLQNTLTEGGVRTIGSLAEEPELTHAWLQCETLENPNLAITAREIVATLERAEIEISEKI